MKITYKEFVEEVNKWAKQDPYMYKSIQYAAKKAAEELALKNVTNVEELYFMYREYKGELFGYSGD